MSAPTATVPAPSGAPPATAGNSTTYAAMAAKVFTTPTLATVPLANRPISYVANMPAVILTSVEEDELRKQRENTLIMKFSAGMPNLYEIRSHIHSEWNLERPPAVGVIDKRHITLHMASSSDTKRALARTKNKINTSMFRLFRWTPDFEVGRDSALAAVWVKMFNLPLHYYNDASLHRLGSILGTVLRIHPSTHGLTQQSYAKICIELDVSKPLIDKLWIGTSKEYGWEITLEYEGNHAYCDYCGLLGHTLGLCRKKREDQGKTVATDNAIRPKETQKSAQGTISQREQWVARNREADTNRQSEKPRLREVNEQHTNDSARVEMSPMPGDILIKDRVHGLSEDIRQKLLEAGLITQSNSGKKLNDQNQDTPLAEATHGSNENTRNIDHGVSSQARIEASNLSQDINRSGGQNSRQIRNRSNKNQSVTQSMGSNSTTPTANKFASLATEEELHKAFENLQQIKDKAPMMQVDDMVNEKLELALVDEYLSDGAGTKDASNIGVQFQSAPNTDGENDENNIGRIRQKKSKHNMGAMRRSTRTIKVKKGPDYYQY